MKPLITFLLVTTGSFATLAQDDVRSIGGAGAFTAGTTFIDGRAHPLLGGRGGVLIDHHLLIGGGGASGWGTTEGFTGGNASLDFGYGGLLVAWWPLDRSALVRPSLEVLIGGGGYQLEQPVEGDLYRIHRDGGFAFSSELGLSFRLHEHIRFSITGGWRSILTDDPVMDGASILAGIWFGEF